MALTGKVVFSSGSSVDFDIWSLDLATGHISQLTSGNNLNDHPRWSPDGTRIAFTRIDEDSIPSVWVMDPDGKGQSKLTENIYCRYPSWHPDGKSIIFSGNGGDRRDLNICSIALDGGGLEILLDFPGIESHPTFTPDGESILFSASQQQSSKFLPNGVSDIMEYHIRSGKLRTLHTHPAHDSGPVCSPDGERIAFTSHRNGQSPEEYQAFFDNYYEILRYGTNAQGRRAITLMKDFQEDGDIYVSNREGTELVQVTNDQLADRSVCWSPCGQYLMYTCTNLKTPNSDRIFVVDSVSGNQVELQYDRSPLEREIGADNVFNMGIFSKLTPEWFARIFVDKSFFGAERHPHWTK